MPLPLGPAARGYEECKLLNGIAAISDVTNDLYVPSDPRLTTGSHTPVSIRAVTAAGTSITSIAVACSSRSFWGRPSHRLAFKVKDRAANLADATRQGKPN